jgi:hypothetical protein
MFSSEERWLIAGVLALLLLGGAVKLFRGHITESTVEKVHLPGVGRSSNVEPARQNSP